MYLLEIANIMFLFLFPVFEILSVEHGNPITN